MEFSSLVSAVVGGLFTVLKFTILSILKLGRWVWDKLFEH